MKIIPVELFEDYLRNVPENICECFDALTDAEISTETFSFYTSVSAIASSRIEGEQMEADSFIKYKMLNVAYQPNLVEKPNDLYKAYLFAQQNELTNENFLSAPEIITAHLLPKSKQGVLRTGNMIVMEHQTGRIQFEAAPASQVEELTERLWADIETLKSRELTCQEVFYYASFIHLVFVCIHPFEDGNGRAARLLEKWFIAQKMGSKAWYLQSELNYYNQVNDYYKNLNRLGIFYDQLNYGKAMPFLIMLADSFTK